MMLKENDMNTPSFQFSINTIKFECLFKKGKNRIFSEKVIYHIAI